MRTDIVKGVCILEFNEQENESGITFEMINNLITILEKIETDSDIYSIIFVGSGRIFFRGHSVKELKEGLSATDISYSDTLKKTYSQLIKIIRNSSKLYISAVNGLCVGSGFGIALSSDLIIASEKAYFISPYADMGLFPDAGLSYFLMQNIGYYRTMQILLTGCNLSGLEAYQAGIVNYLYSKEDIKSKAIELAHKIKKKIKVFSMLKQHLNSLSSVNIDEVLCMEEIMQSKSIEKLKYEK